MQTTLINNFTYQLELNNLKQCTTKSALKSKIIEYNIRSFSITSANKIEMRLPWYTNYKNRDKVQSITLYFNLLQQAITKYADLYEITELPLYVQHLNKFKINITLKE